MFIHGRLSNTADSFGIYTAICPIDSKTNEVEKNNENFGSDKGKNGDFYFDISSQEITGIIPQSISEYFTKNGYTMNKNLFAFNYANQDFASRNGRLLSQYIENIKSSVCDNSSTEIPAISSDIFATKSDLEDMKARFILIGHSNGGLVSRYYIENLGGHINVDKLITIDTPHYGASVFWLSYISTMSLEMGIPNPLAVVLDVELRPDSSLFTDKKWDGYGTGYVHTLNRELIVNYIKQNQSQQLNGNTSVNIKTKYYDIVGVSDNGSAANLTALIGEKLYFDLIPDGDNLYSCIYDSACTKYGNLRPFIISGNCSDNVVEVSSQLGIGRGNDRVDFKKIKMYISPDLDYEQGVWGLALGKMYHVDILSEPTLGDSIFDFILD